MEEELIKEQPSVTSGSARPKLLRYPLRSAAKSAAPDLSISFHSKRGKTGSIVSQSVGVLDFSCKDKSGSAKPPRRISIPAKTCSTPPGPKLHASGGNITPISETGRIKRSPYTPISEISKASSSRSAKFKLITSASYWLNQIKLSESASRHSLSLGFFKLALEAGCEPFQKMQEELKSYVSRHELAADHGETVKELFESYDIKETTEEQEQEQQQKQVSETISNVPEEEGTRSSDDDDDDVHSSSSSMGTGTLKPKCLDIDPTATTTTTTTQLTPAAESTKKETSQKGNPESRLQSTFSTKSPNPRPAFGSGNRKSVKRAEKPSKQEISKEKGIMVRRQGKKSDVKEVPVSTPQRNKENMEALTNEEIIVPEEVV